MPTKAELTQDNENLQVSNRHANRRAGVATAAAVALGLLVAIEGGMVINNSQKPLTSPDGQTSGQSFDAGASRVSAAAGTPDNGATFQTQDPTTTAAETNAAPVTCEKAIQLVWAPVSVKDPKTGKIVEVPIDFEVDGTEHASVTLMNFWSPGVTPANTQYWLLFGDKGLDLSGIGADSKGNPVPTVEPRRIAFEGAGSDWRWNTDVSQGGCGADEVTREIEDHLTRIQDEGTTVVWVTPEQLNALFPGAAVPKQGDGVSR